MAMMPQQQTQAPPSGFSSWEEYMQWAQAGQKPSTQPAPTFDAMQRTAAPSVTQSPVGGGDVRTGYLQMPGTGTQSPGTDMDVSQLLKTLGGVATGQKAQPYQPAGGLAFSESPQDMDWWDEDMITDDYPDGGGNPGGGFPDDDGDPADQPKDWPGDPGANDPGDETGGGDTGGTGDDAGGDTGGGTDKGGGTNTGATNVQTPTPGPLDNLAQRISRALNGESVYNMDDIKAMRDYFNSETDAWGRERTAELEADASRRGVFYGQPLTTSKGTLASDLARAREMTNTNLLQLVGADKRTGLTEAFRNALGFTGLAGQERSSMGQLALAAAQLGLADGASLNNALAGWLAQNGGAGGIGAGTNAFLQNLVLRR